MDGYETVRFQVQERIAALRSERDRVRLAALADQATRSRPSIWRRPAALAGLALIQLGAWLRGERWLPASTTGASGRTPPSGSAC